MEILAYGLLVVALGGAILAIVAFFKDEGGVEGRPSNSEASNSIAGTSVATMSASDEGNAHSGIDGYHGGSYDGYLDGDDAGADSGN
jgi:hypothetical protein